MNPIRFGGATPRPHRHRYVVFHRVTDSVPFCVCGKARPTELIRRGRQSRNYGNRAELAIAKQYGGRKVGHAQGPTDVVGTNTKTQVKTMRRVPPTMWVREFSKLESEKDGRLPRLLLRFVRPGNLGPDDYIVVRGKDWLDWFGKDE